MTGAPGALPLGVFRVDGAPARVGARAHDGVIDVAAALGDEVFAGATLDGFLAAGPEFWRRSHARLADAARSAPRIPFSAVRMLLPFAVADLTDFYSSIDHATHAAEILRPGRAVLADNWRELPVAYHGRAGTVVVSGTPVRRPWGQRRSDGARPVYAPTQALDVEVELGFVVGAASAPGAPVRVEEFPEHVYGAVILLDWSARDIQDWESRPLGPFLGKSFATTISPWVVPLEALAAARVAPPVREPEPLAHLRSDAWSLDIRFELRVDDEVLSRPRYAPMYWTGDQQLAHLTSNGAHVRTGDLYGSGTISGPTADELGSLLELTRGGAGVRGPRSPHRGYLRDGERVEVHARAVTPGGDVDLGSAWAVMEPAVLQSTGG